MNKQRRAEIAKLYKRLEKLQGEWESIRDGLGDVASEERDAFDSMPESLQQGERGQASEQAADSLENVHSEMENVDFDSLMSDLETAGE